MDLRERAQIPLELPGELVEPDRVHRRDAHRACHHLRHHLQACLQVLIPLDDVLAHLVEDLACRRQLHVAARPLEQLAAVALLEHADLLAHRRLGDEVLRSRGREASRFDDVAEDLEGFEMHLLMHATVEVHIYSYERTRSVASRERREGPCRGARRGSFA